MDETQLTHENLLHTYLNTDENGLRTCEFLIDGKVVTVGGVEFLPSGQLKVN